MTQISVSMMDCEVIDNAPNKTGKKGIDRDTLCGGDVRNHNAEN
jgi:hypothetical protein